MNNILRRLIILSLISLYTFLYPLAAIVVSSSMIQTEPTNLKSLLVESKIYNNIDPILKEFIVQQRDVSPFAREILLRLAKPDDPLTGILNDFLRPENLQYNAENFVDAFYLFLEGRENKPVVKLRVVKDPESASLLVRLVMFEQIRSLPECDGTQSLPASAAAYDMSCKPADFTANDIDTVVNQAMGSPEINEFLTRLDKSEVQLDFSGANAELLRSVYSGLKLAKYILPGVLVLILFCAGYLMTNRRKFFGVMAVVTAIWSLCTYLLMDQATANAVRLVVAAVAEELASQPYQLDVSQLTVLMQEILNLSRMEYLKVLAMTLTAGSFFVAGCYVALLIAQRLKAQSDVRIKENSNQVLTVWE